jgi:hypothetical protein
MPDITMRLESLGKIHCTAARRSSVTGEVEIRRNLPPSWAAALRREGSS